MKHKISLILILALLSASFAWAQTSAFYQLPAGVFLSGMTDDGGDGAPAQLHAPHISGETYTFTSETNGKWQSGDADSKSYTLTSKIMKAYEIPHLTVDESKYQYGSKNGTYTSNSYFYVGDSLMRSMTTAKLYGATGGTSYEASANYKTTNYDTLGVYFNNIGVMYIDSISIPVRNNTSGVSKKEQLFPEGSHVILTIYKATSCSGKSGNTLDRNTILYTDELTIANYKTHSSGETRGALNKKFSEPISIDGPFVIELRDMKHSGCQFTVYSSIERTGENKWGYFFNKGSRTFPDSRTPLISVHAMFPVLEKQDTEKALEFASTGGEDAVAIISNFNPNSEDFTVDFGGADWISKGDITYDVTSGESTLTFEADANTTGKTRSATITLKHHGKKLTYTVSQESMPSAFYNVPANAFFAGMTETGDTAAVCKTFYLPYNYGQEYTFKGEEGIWTKETGSTTDKATECSYTSCQMKDSCHTPLLAVDGKVGYQYGASGESFDENLYFHIGDSVMHYMTPARLYGEYGKPTHYLSGNYKTTNYDTVGVYFNNEDVMYIDGISIPIKNSSVANADAMFPTDNAHVIVNIYKATSAGGTSKNKVDRKTLFYTDTLTKGDFKVHPDEPNRGTLNKTFEKPISIEGPFVIELTDVKHSGCAFTVYSSTERTDENMWGYFFSKGSRTFPGNYTPLISVHAMFPVLYGKSEEDLTIDTIPATGSTFGDKDCPTRTIYANVKYNKLDEDGWSREHKVSGVKMDFYKDDRTEESTKWYFVMSPNTSGAVREGDIIFNLRGKKLAYHVTQAAPTLTPREGMEQYFVMSLQDDTVHNTKGDKVTKVYLESEVSLEDAIKVVSKKGLTKIDTTFGSENGKYYVCLTFTRAKYVPTDTEDIITVSFEKNANNKYEYTILHKAVGKLRPDTTCRTFVVGPKGGKALFLNDDNTVGGRYVHLYCDVPATNINASYYSTKHFCTLYHSSSTDIEGRYYKSVSASVDSETTEERLDSFCVYLPGCDTIKFYVRQETTPRVWRHNTTQLTQLEVNNQGGLAHFKGFLTQKVTIVSNTPGTLDINEVEIAFSDGAGEWITPDKTVNSTGDSVFITFDVSPLTGTEPRSTDITVSVLGNEFIVPLTQKTFGIEWSNSNHDEELVVPVAGGTAKWKDSDYPYLTVYGTEAYRDELLVVTAPEGVTINRGTPEILTTGRQATDITFSKKDTLTADWSDSIFISFDSINEAENFEYHFKDTIIITQAAAKVWLADDQQPLEIAAEGGASNEFTIWSNMNIPLKDWTVSQKPTWVDSVTNVLAEPYSGNYYRKLKANAAANTDTEKREGRITIKHKTLTNLSIEINISQDQLLAQTYTRSGLTPGNWGTICLPYASASFSGAEMYSIAGKMDGDAGIYLDQVNIMEAGVPYLFKATADKIEVVYAAAEPQKADTVNGLYGYIGESEESYITVPKDAGNYIVYQNALYLVDSEVTIASNRAYIKYNEVGVPSQAPQIRRVAMPINGAPANILQVNDTKQAVKILRDGHIVILRADKEYDILGQSK